MPPEHFALVVLLEKSAFAARQKCTRELECLMGYLQDVIQALGFEDPSELRLGIQSKLAGVLWTSNVECCALMGNIVVGGEADGVSKFGSDEQAK